MEGLWKWRAPHRLNMLVVKLLRPLKEAAALGPHGAIVTLREIDVLPVWKLNYATNLQRVSEARKAGDCRSIRLRRARTNIQQPLRVHSGVRKGSIQSVFIFLGA